MPFYETGLEELLEVNVSKKNLRTADDLNTLVQNTEGCFICVGTPTKNNSIDLSQIKSAVESLVSSIKNNEKILVYGDYDVDGTTSVAMVYIFLSRLTENVAYYIPDRYTEGYGISLEGINYAKENNFTLVIALDCGIRAVNQVNYANEKGIDFIICDHHNPTEVVPNSVAILNPKQKDCNYPFKELSGCGVGFKLIQGYCEKNRIPLKEITPLLDFLVVSIAADIVPMVDENRVFSFFGLKQINSTPRVGIKALMDSTGRKGKWNCIICNTGSYPYSSRIYSGSYR